MKKPPASSETTVSPPEGWKPLSMLVRIAKRPLEHFLRIEAASGILLLIAAAMALLWANSPWGDSYQNFWGTPLTVKVGEFTFERPVDWFVNDILMVIFFFVVGLEIRREIHHGELSEWRRAALPAVGALGGMVAPALLYLVFASPKETYSGWGVPMATDIAFAIGVLTLLAKRVPPALRVFLLALAVIDDLGAIVVIAVFYSSGISWFGMLTATLGIGGILSMQRFGVRSKFAYVFPASVVWAGVYVAGIHPTVAGVIVGLLTPVRVWVGVEAKSPVETLIESLHSWVAFGIMPVFALANSGVRLGGMSLDSNAWGLISGIVVGLVLGKPLGILSATWLSLKLRIGSLPRGLSLRHLIVLGFVAGIGFTMAIFIAQLAFVEPKMLAVAKLAVLSASLIAAAVGVVLGLILLPPVQNPRIARTADEAERSTEI